MKIKPNYFNSSEAIVRTIIKKDGKPYTIRESRMRFFFPDEWMAFYDSLTSDRQKITFSFLINTGARIDEVSNVQVSDIDFERNTLILRKTKRKSGDSGQHKIRAIPVSSQFSKYLKKIVNDHHLKAEDYFPLLSCAGSNKIMKLKLQELGIKDWRSFSDHNIRKTTEAWLLALDVDSLKIIKHMGHTMKIAAGHYVSPETFTFEDKKMMRDVIGDLYYGSGRI